MSLRLLARNAGSSAAQVVLSTALLFGLYSVLTQYLSVSDIGLWSLVIASTSIARLSEFGLGGGVMRFVAADVAAGARPLAARTIGMAIVLVGALVAVVSLIAYVPLRFVLTHIVSANELGQAIALLPYALGSLFAGSIGGVLLNALDGFQRTAMRAVTQLAGSCVQFVAALWFVPRYGLLSLGGIQLLQAISVTLLALVCVFLTLRVSLVSWFGWDRRRAIELIRYGSGIQVGAIGQLLFEPTVKALLTSFGGLALTGYFEMANRMILQLRSVIVSAFVVLVPYVAGRLQQSPDQAELRKIYMPAYRFLFAAALAYYGLIGAALPLILHTWLGRTDLDFLRVAVFCWAGWFANTLVAPAYFLYLASGKLRWTVVSQLAIGGFNVLIALPAGVLFGGYGVLVGSMVALFLGSWLITIQFHLEHRIPLPDVLPSESVLLALFCASVSLTSILLGLRSPGVLSEFAAAAAGLTLLCLLGCVVFLWRHPLRRELYGRLLTGV